MNHEGAENDGGDDVPRDAQRQQRNHGCAGGTVVSGFGGGNAFQFPLPEVVGNFRGALGLGVGKEGGRRAADARNRPHDDADQTAANHGFEAALPLGHGDAFSTQA